MKKVLFYTENSWVLGKIHNELSKVLYPDVYCDILSWDKTYTIEEMTIIASKYDYIMSEAIGCFVLNDTFFIPYNKLIILSHDSELFPKSNIIPLSLFNEVKGYAVIAPLLQTISITKHISRIPTVLRIGVFQNNYPKNLNDTCDKVGFFFVNNRNTIGFESKRGDLILNLINRTNLEISHRIDIHFLGVEQLYKDIDLIIIASLLEGNPYPMLEGFACGIPVLSTRCGISPEYLSKGGGILLPLEEDKFLEEGEKIITRLKTDKDYYRQLSNESYEIGSSIDWSVIRTEWINFINNLD